MICGSLQALEVDVRWLDVIVEMDPTNPYGHCCLGAFEDGPAGCTCWEPIFDQEATDPAPGALETRRRMCEDCAYRANSPERAGGDWLPGLEQGPFWCHQGMRRVVAWRHPLGMQLPAGIGDYRPPVVDRIPYRADGRPGLRCAGWAAQRGVGK